MLRCLYLPLLGLLSVLRGKQTINQLLGEIEMNKLENRLQFWKTLYFCFRTMPFRFAIKTPVWIYGKISFYNLSGKVLPLNGILVHSGMVKIGLMDQTRSISDRSSITLTGIFQYGSNITIRQGAKWNIGGELIICDGCMLADNVSLFVSTRCLIEDNCVLAFNCMLMDSDVHYMIDVQTHEINNNNSPIRIGRGSWVGNYTMIKKGGILPTFTIVAGPYSSIGKDYAKMNLPKYAIIGGNPAKLIKNGMREVNNGKMELFLNDFFRANNKVYKWEGDIEELCAK